MSSLHDHAHDHHNHGNPFFVPFLLILIFAIVEFFGGVFTSSLSLLGDAWHMFSDVMALGVAMLASYQANKSSDNKNRVELYASALNAFLMLILVVWIVYEAIERINQPRPVAGMYVMVIAFIGLLVNLYVAKHLHHIAHHHGGSDSLNHRAALLHVLGDILGSVAALAAGGIIYFTGWNIVDPILSILISLLLLVVTWNLIRDIWKTYVDMKQTAQ